MAVTKKSIDRAVTFVAALSAPVLTLCIHVGALSSLVATDIGAIVAAAIGSYHTGAVVEKRRGSAAQAEAEQLV